MNSTKQKHHFDNPQEFNKQKVYLQDIIQTINKGNFTEINFDNAGVNGWIEIIETIERGEEDYVEMLKMIVILYLFQRIAQTKLLLAELQRDLNDKRTNDQQRMSFLSEYSQKLRLVFFTMQKIRVIPGIQEIVGNFSVQDLANMNAQENMILSDVRTIANRIHLSLGSLKMRDMLMLQMEKESIVKKKKTLVTCSLVDKDNINASFLDKSIKFENFTSAVKADSVYKNQMELNKLKNTLDAQHNEEMRKLNEEHQKEMKEKDETIQNQKDFLSEITLKNAEYEKMLLEGRETIERLEQRIKQLEHQIKESEEGKKMEMDMEYKRLKGENDELNTKLKNVEKSYEEKKEQMENEKNELKINLEKIEEEKNELKSLKEELSMKLIQETHSKEQLQLERKNMKKILNKKMNLFNQQKNYKKQQRKN